LLNQLLFQPNYFARRIYPKALWKVETDQPTLYLTFDDGPIPGLTEWVLDTLSQRGVKATFFCVGGNIQKHPELFERIKNEGHTVGNHTQNHIKGYYCSAHDYLMNVEACESLTKTKLFRPPYGQLKFSQYKQLLTKGYKIILWDVISYDYENITPESCFENVKRHAQPGSIILFHDNVKAEDKIKYALPATIDHFLKLNYNFAAL
jgi:peptidoglycan/xylan/chitin deacetylase (PgdA/CDA1 family)